MKNDYCNGEFRTDFGLVKRCPRCDGFLPIGVAGALSRVDKKTEICPWCEMFEAMQYWCAFAANAAKKMKSIVEDKKNE